MVKINIFKNGKLLIFSIVIFLLIVFPTTYPTNAISSSKSYNWAGYAVPTSSNAVGNVYGDWYVPTVSSTTCSQDYSAGFTTYMSIWVGIGGFTQGTNLEQVGVQISCNGDSSASYNAFYEIAPAGAPNNLFNVKPGDHIQAYVSYSSGTFTFYIHDLTIAKSSTKTYSASGSLCNYGCNRNYAEWIVEDSITSSGYIQFMPAYGSVTFVQEIAQISGNTESLGYWSSSALRLYTYDCPDGMTIQSANTFTYSGSPVPNSGYSLPLTQFTVTYTGAPYLDAGGACSSGGGGCSPKLLISCF